MIIYGDEAASKYLLEERGVSHAPATLRKKRVTGGGPAFLVFNGRFCGYPKEMLDSWAVERTQLVGSTSEVGHGKPADMDEAVTEDANPKGRAENKPDAHTLMARAGAQFEEMR